MKKFKRIFIEISNVCNLACSFCPPSNRVKHVMSVEDFETILQKIEGHGDHIYLHVKGEPLFHPNLKEILELCHQYNKKVNITTNGTLLGEHGQMILESPAVRLVNISLQSYEEDTELSAYNKYLDTVLNFVKKGLKETPILFDMRLWNFEDEQLVACTKNQNTLDYIDAFLELPNPITVVDPKIKGIKLSSNVFISKGCEFEWPSLNNDVVGTTGNCFGLRHQLAILSTGVVVPCCLDAEGVNALGNILEGNLQEIVTTPKAKKITIGFQGWKMVEPLCIRCSYRKRFDK